MFELSVNLEYLFNEAGEDIPDRIAAAATAGFRRVELFMTAGRDVDTIANSLTTHGLELWSVVADPRTQLVNPETHAEFASIFETAAADAQALRCPHVVVGSGPAVPYQKRTKQLDTVTAAVASVVDIAEQYDVTILIEAVNTRVDHPGVLFSETSDSLAIVRGVESPRVRLLYDLYHSVVEGEDPAQILPGIIDVVAHVQIADVPGRGEPGSGTIDWPVTLEQLGKAGYQGVVGIECHPTRTPTAEALAYIQELCGRG